MILALCNNIYLAVVGPGESYIVKTHITVHEAAPYTGAGTNRNGTSLFIFLDDAVRREAHAARHADELVVDRHGEHY